jgi:hypothetical protein
MKLHRFKTVEDDMPNGTTKQVTMQELIEALSLVNVILPSDVTPETLPRDLVIACRAAAGVLQGDNEPVRVDGGAETFMGTLRSVRVVDADLREAHKRRDKATADEVARNCNLPRRA